MRRDHLRWGESQLMQRTARSGRSFAAILVVFALGITACSTRITTEPSTIEAVFGTGSIDADCAAAAASAASSDEYVISLGTLRAGDERCLSQQLTALTPQPYAPGIDSRTGFGLIAYALSGDVLFEFGSAELTEEAEATVRELARTVMSETAGGRVAVLGHTDSIGSEAANLTLSQRRAAAVADVLAPETIGVELMVQGLGEQAPRAPNVTPDGADNPEGRAANRRVEIIAAVRR